MSWRARTAVMAFSLIAVCGIAFGLWSAATSMSHGVSWGLRQGLKAVFDFATWASIVALFVSGGALFVRYGIRSDKSTLKEGG